MIFPIIISLVALVFSFCYIVDVSWKLTGIAVGASFLWSCSQNSVSEKKIIAKPDFVGVVDRVYPAQKYVLVRIGGVIPIPGTTLISHAQEGEGNRVANLVVSPERLGNLRVPADIRSGSVETGDLVFIYKGFAPPDSRESEESEAALDSQENKNKEEDQKKNESFPPGLPPGADGLLPSSWNDEMPAHGPLTS